MHILNKHGKFWPDTWLNAGSVMNNSCFISSVSHMSYFLCIEDERSGIAEDFPACNCNVG